MGRIRTHLTYSNVMVTVLAFVVLGGTAWAVAKNSIGTKQLKANAVHTQDIDNGAVTAEKIADGVIPDVQGGGSGGGGSDGGGSNLPTATVRSTTQAINMTCNETSFGGFSQLTCNGQETVTAPCQAGEHATGGGYTTPASTGSGPQATVSIQDTRPEPTSGTPTAWQLRVTASHLSSGSTSPLPRPPDPEVTAYAICTT